MGNAAKKLDLTENTAFEKWLKEEAVPYAQDVKDGKVKCLPLMEAYELTMNNLAQKRKNRQSQND